MYGTIVENGVSKPQIFSESMLQFFSFGIEGLEALFCFDWLSIPTLPLGGHLLSNSRPK